jgi:hypothetical protein
LRAPLAILKRPLPEPWRAVDRTQDTRGPRRIAAAMRERHARRRRQRSWAGFDAAATRIHYGQELSEDHVCEERIHIS